MDNISSIIQVTTPPPSTAVSRCTPVTDMIVRVATLVCLLLSVIVTASNNLKDEFYGFLYRYMLGLEVVGIVCTLHQIAFSIYFGCTGTRIAGRGLRLFQFFADKGLSFFLAMGPPAAFGMMNDESDKEFTTTAKAVSSLLLIGSLFSFVASICSSFALPKKP